MPLVCGLPPASRRQSAWSEGDSRAGLCGSWSRYFAARDEAQSRGFSALAEKEVLIRHFMGCKEEHMEVNAVAVCDWCRLRSSQTSVSTDSPKLYPAPEHGAAKTR